MKKKSGFTLIELLIVIAIIALLAAILFPVFARARESARRSSCLSNLRQMGTGLMQYTQNYDERLPLNDNGPLWASGQAASWMDLLRPYIKGDQIYLCPSATEAEKSRIFLDYDNSGRPFYSYAINNVYYANSTQRLFEKSGPATLASIEDTVNTVFAGDSRVNGDDHWGFQVTGTTLHATKPPTFGAADGSQGQFAARHLGGANFVFFDGHVKWLTLEKMTERDSGGTLYRYFSKTLD